MSSLTSPPPLFGAGPPVQGAAAPPAEDDAAVLSSDFETFLKMLTVQVQNQDPLNPVDSTEYATQLATFSSVEQQVQSNDLLRQISNTLNGSALQQLSGWIGMEGLVRAPVRFTGAPVAVRPETVDGADRAVLVVRNGSGTEVQRFDIETGQSNVLWGGADSRGTPLPPGIYRFDVESYAGDSLLSTQQAQVYSRIEEVRDDGGTIRIRMSDGSDLAENQITGLRAPDAGL
jgi:flagellar basal-body rod modification protein FlgD